MKCRGTLLITPASVTLISYQMVTFQLIWLIFQKKKNHYYMIALKRLCIMALSYIWEILTVPKMPILDQPNVIAKVTHGNKCQPRKL